MSNIPMANLIFSVRSGRVGTAGAKSGTCLQCKCTDARACPEGCVWVNDEQTICSACLERLMEARGGQLIAMLTDAPVPLLMAGLRFAKTFEALITQALKERREASAKRLKQIANKAGRKRAA